MTELEELIRKSEFYNRRIDSIEDKWTNYLLGFGESEIEEIKMKLDMIDEKIIHIKIGNIGIKNKKNKDREMTND